MIWDIAGSFSPAPGKLPSRAAFVRWLLHVRYYKSKSRISNLIVWGRKLFLLFTAMPEADSASGLTITNLIQLDTRSIRTA
eukprot:6213494-Pleurochrysis_carterae.AAC.3